MIYYVNNREAYRLFSLTSDITLLVINTEGNVTVDWI